MTFANNVKDGSVLASLRWGAERGAHIGANARVDFRRIRCIAAGKAKDKCGALSDTHALAIREWQELRGFLLCSTGFSYVV